MSTLILIICMWLLSDYFFYQIQITFIKLNIMSTLVLHTLIILSSVCFEDFFSLSALISLLWGSFPSSTIVLTIVWWVFTLSALVVTDGLATSRIHRSVSFDISYFEELSPCLILLIWGICCLLTLVLITFLLW